MRTTGNATHREPWNKGKIGGQKAPAGLKSEDYLFPSRLHDSPHLGARQYARILGHWVDELGLDRGDWGNALDATHQGDADLPTHEGSACSPAAARTLQARVTVRHLGIEVDDALEISEQMEI
jgi:hypothetical protein